VARPPAEVSRLAAMVRVSLPAGVGASTTLAAVADSTVLSWNGRSSGCFDLISEAAP
jgi:hypothetical protein